VRDEGVREDPDGSRSLVHLALTAENATTS